MSQPPQLQIKPEDLIKIQKRKNAEDSNKVDPENLVIAEFGYYFGYEGIKAIWNNEIDLQTVKVLIKGARKTWKADIVDMAIANRIAVAAAMSRNGTVIMKKGLNPFIKGAQADV